jgi:4-carboxymuconolactone decarboxylase
MKNRIPPVCPPYPADVEASLRKWMPPGSGLEPLKLFRTLARHAPLSDRLRHLGAFFLGHGALPARTRELVILRACARCDAEYEWGVHVTAFGATAGLDRSDIEATVRRAPTATGLDAITLRAVDELHDLGTLTDATWEELRAHFDANGVLEFVALTGFYHVVSFLVNAAGVEHEAWAERFPPDVDLSITTEGEDSRGNG